jgi:Patatin-like phospholipase
MSKESAKTLPLPLAHMLEEEYVRLYGSEEEPLERRWSLQPEEILDARLLARKLAEALGSRTPANLAAWRTASGHDPVYRTAIAEEINVLLSAIAPARWLFEDEAFKETKKAPYTQLGKATTFEPGAVFNLNREMFDRLYSDFVRRAADMRYAEIIRRIHARAKKGQLRTALSISGGGIRSATFALGVMQGLARTRILEKFDYISTVSGGGYIGSWISSWVRRNPWGIRGVAAQLAARPSDPLEPEPPPVRHLRAFSNYLTPRLGLLSADTWSLVATYVRNLLLNWVVLIPLLAGVLAIPRYMLTAVVRDPHGSTEYASRGAIAGTVVGLLLLFFSLGFLVWFRPVTDSAKKKSLTDGSFVKFCLLPLIGASISFTLAWAWYTSAVRLRVTDPDPFGPWWFIRVTTGACLASFVVFVYHYLHASFVEKRSRIHGNPLFRLGAEFIGSIGAGLLGGGLVWLAAHTIFKVPVQAVASVDTVRWPIAQPGGLSAVTATYVCFGVPLLMTVLFLQAVVFVGATSHYNEDFDREWWARASGWVLLGALLWIALSAISIYGPVAIYQVPGLLTTLGGGAGLFSLLAGRSDKTTAGSKEKDEESKSGKALNFALGLAVPVFVIFVLALISTGTTAILRETSGFERVPPKRLAEDSRLAAHASRQYTAVLGRQVATIKEAPLANAEQLRSVEHLQIVQTADPYTMLAIAFGCPLLALLVSRFIGVNVFSMHAMYRNRLVRAYLGASRLHREPNAFTGFDPRDNLGMHELRPEYLWAYSFRDVDRAAAALASPNASPQLEFLAKQINDALGSQSDDLFDKDAQASSRHSALYQTLNSLIASTDLQALFDPKGGPTAPVRRALRNRRFVETAFGDGEVYPSPMPALCAHDVIVSDEELVSGFAEGASPQTDALRALFRHPAKTFAAILDEINDVIATRALSEIPPFDVLTVDTTPFTVPGTTVHRMIDNRLRLDAALPRLVTPLRYAQPLHVVNICLNLTTGEELAWQERKGASFTVSPLSSGNYALGYRDTSNYGDISVGTAVTISGAAASPNMGYHSSPALAFLMTLFNVRLGWWLGNPGVAGNKTYRRRNPRSSILPFIYEATGNSNDRYPYVYLSDGGHFENLALYEMVLRRTHRIVVSDAGADPKYIYDDLGNAVRKIRIDLGIPIDITHMGIIPPTEKKPGKYCAVGKIRYSTVDGPDAEEGQLLYIKPVVYSDEGPRDVLNYSKNSADFPHESTADQWFSESQFESYRRLGYFAIEQISQQTDGLSSITLDALIQGAKEDLTPTTGEEVVIS